MSHAYRCTRPSLISRTHRHLADAFILRLTDGRPLAAPAAHLRPLGGVEGVERPLTAVALPWASHVPAGRCGGVKLVPGVVQRHPPMLRRRRDR